MKEVKLKDVAKVVIGISAPKNFIKENDFNAVPFIRAGLLEDLSNGKENYIEYLNRDNYKIVPKNTVVFAKSGMSALKNRVYCLKNDSVIVGHLAGITCNHKQLYFKYLEYYLKHNKPSQLNQNDSYPSIRTEDIENIMIKLPEVEVQQEIAKKLDCLNNLISIRKKQIKELDQLIKSQFVEMFGDGKYNKKCLNDISIIKGEYGSGASAGEYVKGKPRYVRITDIQEDGRLNNNSMASPKNENNSEKYTLDYGDILFARTGATVGKTYKYSKDDGFCIYAGYCIRFRLDLEKANPDYIFTFTKTNEYKKWVANKQRVVAQPNINAKEYGNDLLIPIPPIELQNRFAEFVKLIDKQKVELQKSLDEMEKLQESLMNKYFS